jgi:hypothetical protein
LVRRLSGRRKRIPRRDGGLSQIKGDPLLKSLERDPRYAAFSQKDAPARVIHSR